MTTTEVGSQDAITSTIPTSDKSRLACGGHRAKQRFSSFHRVVILVCKPTHSDATDVFVRSERKGRRERRKMRKGSNNVDNVDTHSICGFGYFSHTLCWQLSTSWSSNETGIRSYLCYFYSSTSFDPLCWADRPFPYLLPLPPASSIFCEML